MGTKNRRNNRKSRGLSARPLAITSALVILLVIFVWQCSAQNKNQKGTKAQDTVTLSTDEIEQLCMVIVPESFDNTIVKYTGYISAFNASRRIPNYVAYELTGEETLGSEPRSNKFLCDYNVEGCPTTQDYVGSGYDRGHMAPAGDMKWNEAAMTESFYMTNICPQNHALNGGGWKRLEEKVRNWAQRDSALIVITGPIVGKNADMLNSGVTVPTGFFKVLFAPYANPQRAIGFIYKNEGGQKKPELQAVSIDDVEVATGYDFFSSLPDDIEAEIEATCNYQEWNN